VIVGWYLLASVVLAGLVFALLQTLRALKAQIDQKEAQITALLAQVEQLLSATTTRIEAISERTEGILTQGEATAETVHDRIDRTSTAVQRTVFMPLIGINSLAAGVSRGFQTFSRLQQSGSRSSQAVTAGPPAVVSLSQDEKMTFDSIAAASAAGTVPGTSVSGLRRE
jgi:hypothetical protein